MAVDHRSRTGEWPQPHRLDWRWLTGELGDAIAGGISSWARAWRREAKPLVRVAEILLSLGLMIRAGIWSAACAVGGDGSPEVRHGFDAEPIAGARLDTRVGIAVLELAIVGVWSQWAPVVLAWPPGIVTAASLIWVAQAGPLLWDTPLTAYAIIQTMIQSDSTPTTEVNR
jgi:hypothetical protein